jgi:alpha-galactosidase
MNHQNIKTPSTLLLLGLILAVPLLHAVDLAGTWRLEQAAPGPGGRGRVVIAVFKVDGNTFTGTYAPGGNRSDIVNGVINGNQITFDVRGEFSEPVTYTRYKGELKGEELTVSLENPPPGPGRFGGGPVVLRKVSADTVYKPPPELAPKHQPFPPFKPIPWNGLAKTPPMGWNSWNKFARRIDDKTVREIADAMVASGMRDAGYVYVNIDDTWEGKRDENGAITTNEKFPDMKALADYVHGKGLKLGIYSGPGPRTCAGFEGSYGHEEQDARTFAAWGIDYLKYDWCSASQMYRREEMAPAYQKMALALRATGRPIVYSLCQYGWLNVGEWGAAAGGNLWRTTGDIRDTWESMARIGFGQNGREKYAKPGHWNDPDMLEVGNGGMNDTEYRTHFSLWAILAAPLLAGNDLRTMSDATKEILLNKEVIAVNQDKLGLQGFRVWQEGELEIWKKPLDGAVALGLFNRSAQTARMTVRLADLGVTKKKPKVRDLWAHQDLDVAGEYAAEVPSHGVVMLRVQ